MALYSELQIFKSAYDLYLVLFRDLSNNVPREIRYTLLQDLKKDVLKILVLIYKANSSTDKSPYLTEAKSLMVEVKIFIRILSDIHAISQKKYAQIVEIVGDISKQLTSWHKYVANNQ